MLARTHCHSTRTKDSHGGGGGGNRPPLPSRNNRMDLSPPSGIGAETDATPTGLAVGQLRFGYRADGNKTTKKRETLQQKAVRGRDDHT